MQLKDPWQVDEADLPADDADQCVLRGMELYDADGLSGQLQDDREAVEFCVPIASRSGSAPV